MSLGNQMPEQPKNTSNLSATAQFVKMVLDPFYLKLEEADIIRIANDMVKKGNEVSKEDAVSYSNKCRELAAARIEEIKKDNINDAEQTDKIANVLNNFIEKMIVTVIPANLA